MVVLQNDEPAESLVRDISVPPTPVTSGLLGGYPTASPPIAGLKGSAGVTVALPPGGKKSQLAEPTSPAAFTMVTPSALPCWRSVSKSRVACTSQPSV